MNATQCVTTDMELDICGHGSMAENYATTPMVAVTPIPPALDEETLYTQFEEAMSDRLVALHGRLDRLSFPVHETSQVCYATDQLACISPDSIDASTHTSLLNDGWRRMFIYTCGAFILIMLGFDLMGLLVLHAR